MNKVLIITYYWPPSGGAGVQRWLKFAKYLPEFGWEPIILTIDPKYAAYPVTDYSLIVDLPGSVKVYSTPATNFFTIYKKDKSRIPAAGFANNIDDTLRGKLLRFIRGNLFLPDPRRGWNKFAFEKACKLIETEDIQHIITTSPPHSTQLIGLKIKKKYPGIKWIVDLRDPWTDIYYYKQFYPTIISKAIDLRYEKSVLINSDRIITVGTSLKTLFSSKVKGIENKSEVITNGYDEEDFKGIPTTNPSRFTVTYVGTLSDIYPVKGLITALKNLQATGKDFNLRFVGAVSENSRKIIISEIKQTSLEFLPYAAHSEAIKFMMDSTMLILIIPLHESNKSIITGKLFEYIATGKPVLCLGPVDGDAAGIIKKCGSGETVDYDNTERISEFLGTISQYSGRHDEEVKNFSRFNLTRQIAEVLETDYYIRKR
jgi:glycosyltransferase involved in cell wall biosynthesis